MACLILLLLLHPVQGKLLRRTAAESDKSQLESMEAAPIPNITPVIPEAAPIYVVPDLFPDPRKKVTR